MVTVDVPPLHAIGYEFTVAVIAAGSVDNVTVPYNHCIGNVYTTVPTDCVKIPVPVYGAVPPLH